MGVRARLKPGLRPALCAAMENLRGAGIVRLVGCAWHPLILLLLLRCGHERVDGDLGRPVRGVEPELLYPAGPRH